MYKKLTALFLLLAALLSLSACSAVAQCEPQVTNMLAAISEGDADAAFALMHPESGVDRESFDEAFAVWVKVMDERTWDSYQIRSVNVSNKLVPDKERAETAQYTVTLKDESKLTLEYVYVTNTAGEGFKLFVLADTQST